MTVRTPAILTSVIVILASGCGTVNNLYRSQFPGQKLEPYGGVKEDVDDVRELGTPEWNAGYRDKREVDRAFDALGTVLRVALDLPFSLIGDTLVLPFALRSPAPTPDVEKRPTIAQDVPEPVPTGGASGLTPSP